MANVYVYSEIKNDKEKKIGEILLKCVRALIISEVVDNYYHWAIRNKETRIQFHSNPMELYELQYRSFIWKKIKTNIARMLYAIEFHHNAIKRCRLQCIWNYLNSLNFLI